MSESEQTTAANEEESTPVEESPTAQEAPAAEVAAPAGEGRTAHIKKRNVVMVIVLSVITLGIYAIYWYYSTLKELHQANGKADSALKWTLIMFIPIIGLLSAWHHSSEYAEFVDGKYPGIAIFILWLVFVPVVWILVQSDLNRAASPSS